MRTVIDEHLKNNEFANLYLLYGEERYLIRFYKNKLIRANVAEGDTMNFMTFHGPKIDEAELIDAMNTLPFFAKKRVILVENSGFFASKSKKDEGKDEGKSGERLAKCLGEIPDTVMVIFTEETITERLKTVKAAQGSGVVEEFKTPSGEDLRRWCVGYIKLAGKEMSKDAYEELLKRGGNDLSELSIDLEKLIAYTGERTAITREDVVTMLPPQLDFNVFYLIDGVAEKNPDKVMREYHLIVDDAKTESPLGLMGRIAQKFRQMLSVVALSENGASNGEIMKTLGIKEKNEWMIRKLNSAAANFSIEDMRSVLSDIAMFDTGIKTGIYEDRIALESLLLKYSK